MQLEIGISSLVRGSRCPTYETIIFVSADFRQEPPIRHPGSMTFSPSAELVACPSPMTAIERKRPPLEESERKPKRKLHA